MKVTTAKLTQCTWEEAFEGFVFWKQAQGLSITTITGYKNVITHFFKRFPYCWQSAKLRNSIIQHMADNIKPATYNLRLIYLRALFDWCIREGYLDVNPLSDFKKRKAQPRIVNIPEDVLQSLLKLPDQTSFAGLRDYTLILLTLDTGIRPKEAFNLKPQDIDLKHFFITIPEEVAKTRVTRSLPILPPTAKALNKLIRARHPAWAIDTPIFCSCEGTTLSRHTWGDRIEMYSIKLGFKIRPYDLRHAFALLYLRNGGHAFALQKSLGHTDMSMTKRYVNLTGQDLKNTHAKASPLNKLIVTKKKDRIRKISI